MKKLIFIIMNGIFLISNGMEDSPKAPRRSLPKSPSESNSLRSMASIARVLSSEKIASPNSSPTREDKDKITSPRKSSPLTGSPTGSRVSKTIGKRDSKQFSDDLKAELAKLEKSEIQLTEAELDSRFEKAKEDRNPVTKKKELRQLAGAKIKGDITLNVERMKQEAARIVFDMNAHEIELALKNRLIYQSTNHPQETANQVSASVRLFYESHDLLLQIYESDMTVKEFHMNRMRTWEKMAPIFAHLIEHLKKDVSQEPKKLDEYQNAIQKAQFLFK